MDFLRAIKKLGKIQKNKSIPSFNFGNCTLNFILYYYFFQIWICRSNRTGNWTSFDKRMGQHHGSPIRNRSGTNVQIQTKRWPWYFPRRDGGKGRWSGTESSSLYPVRLARWTSGPKWSSSIWRWAFGGQRKETSRPLSYRRGKQITYLHTMYILFS